MSNYSQITAFGPKDSLTAGDPNKKIKGSEFDAEFSAISTAVASKLNSSDFASTLSGQSVVETQITDGSLLARVGGNETITGTWNFTTAPTISGYTVWHSNNDGAASGLDSDLLDGQHGTYYLNATNINAGTLATARLPSNIAYYDAGSITFSGTITFSNTITVGTVAGTITVSGNINHTGTCQLNGLDMGYMNIPQNSQSANYTCVLGDNGKHILHPNAGGAGDTFTIPANASVAYPLGATLTFVNRDSNSVSIAITTDTMYLAGTTTTGTRTLGQNGIATAIKVESTVWIISGTGLS